MILTGDLLSTNQAARRLGVGPDRVRQLVTEGRLPFIRTPLGKLFDANDVQRLAAARAAQKGAGT